MNSEIASAMGRFFDGGKGPSHDELDGVFRKSNLSPFDPAPDAESRSVGKMKRVRGAILDGSQADPAATLMFVKDLTAKLKARGCFIQGNEQFAGESTVRAAQSAMGAVGWRLDVSGDLYPVGIAGPGTGKTFSLIRRVARFIEAERCPAEEILVLTFARTAAQDLVRALQPLAAGAVRARTVHSHCFSMLSSTRVLAATGRTPRIAADFERDLSRLAHTLRPRTANIAGEVHVVQWTSTDDESSGIASYIADQINAGTPPTRALVLSSYVQLPIAIAMSLGAVRGRFVARGQVKVFASDFLGELGAALPRPTLGARWMKEHSQT